MSERAVGAKVPPVRHHRDVGIDVECKHAHCEVRIDAVREGKHVPIRGEAVRVLRRVVDLRVGVDTVSGLHAKTRADIRMLCETSQVPPRLTRHALEERLEMQTAVYDQRPHQRLDVAAVQIRTAVVQSAEDFAVA